MSKLKIEGYNLGPVEKRIILAFAHTEPQTINATKETIEGHYKSVNNAFHSLLKKELIKAVDKKKYRNQEYDIFWLTLEGALLAMLHRANSDIMKEYYEKVYGKSEDTDLIFDLVKAFPEKMREIYTMFKTTTEGKMKLKNMPISNNEMQKFIKIVFKYPSYRKTMKKTIGHAFKILEKMVDEAE